MKKTTDEKILISIIMPAYNSEQYIGDAISSVIAQTYQKWELIIIDDASKDNTANIVKEFMKQDNRIRFYKNEKNNGVSATRNTGISLSIGEWIAFLDSDDLWVPNKLEKQIKLKNNNKQANFIFTGSSYIDENSNPYLYELEIPEKVKYKDLLKQNIISCSSVLVKKQCLSGIKMERDNMHEDFAMWLKILKNEPWAYGINEPLLIYRLSKSSKSGNKIKAAKMTVEVYRYMGLNLFQLMYYVISYIIKSLKKYRKIKSSYSLTYF